MSLLNAMNCYGNESAIKPSASCNSRKIECIEVSGSQYRIASSDDSLSFSKETIEKLPHLADDLFRLIPMMPGVSSGDFSANFHVRGGTHDELLVLLDGQQLYRPFHLKDYAGGVFSIVDSTFVERLSFSSGGFAAPFGNKMSGVLDIQSLDDINQQNYHLGASFINLRAGGQGSFNQDQGEWLIAARRGYLDLILALDGEKDNQVKPAFGDLFVKISQQLNNQHRLAFRLLSAVDDMELTNRYSEHGEVINESIDSFYDNHYLWLTLDSDWSLDLSATTKLATGRVKEDRNGYNRDPSVIDVSVNDLRKFDFIDFSQQWQLNWHEQQVWQFGYGLLSAKADYDYQSQRTLFEAFGQQPLLARDIKLSFDGQQYHAYVNHKYQFNDHIFSELGIRWDRQTNLGFSDSQLSPRVSMVYMLDEQVRLAASWGRYYQADDMLELQVTDGVEQFSRAQKSQHSILSYQQLFDIGLTIRAELYRKDIANPKARYENVFDPYVLFPEGHADRVLIAPQHSRLEGFEISVQHRVNQSFNWLASYAFSKAVDVINGEKFSRSWAQRHSLNMMMNYQFTNGWQFATALEYHSGWPQTPAFGTAVKQQQQWLIESHIGKRNSEKLKNYLRLDIRMSKTLKWQNSEFSYFIEVFNVLNRDNECCTLDHDFQLNENQTVTVIPERSHWIGIVPSLGVSWKF